MRGHNERVTRVKFYAIQREFMRSTVFTRVIHRFCFTLFCHYRVNGTTAMYYCVLRIKALPLGVNIKYNTGSGAYIPPQNVMFTRIKKN